MDVAFVSFLLWAFGLFVLYWVIRLAVRHALEDVNGRDRRNYLLSATAVRPAGQRPPPPAD